MKAAERGLQPASWTTAAGFGNYWPGTLKWRERRTPLLRLEVDVVAFERGAFLRVEIGERLIVIGERPDFL